MNRCIYTIFALSIVASVTTVTLSGTPASALHTRPFIAIESLPFTQSTVIGGEARWTVTVTNKGDVSLGNVNVADSAVPGCRKTFRGSLAPGVQRKYSCSDNGVTASFKNEFIAHGTARDGTKAEDQSSATVTIVGLALSKSCTSSTPIGQPYMCKYSISTIDPAKDTLTVIGLTDQVFSADGTVTSPGGPNGYLSSLVSSASFTGGASCTGSPVVCRLPYNSTIMFGLSSFYVVSPDDYNLPEHELLDTVTAQWQDMCNHGTKNCPGPGLTQSAEAGSSSIVEQ